jgi:hypothetical protein
MSGGNPRLGPMQDLVVGIPQIAMQKDPDTGQHYGVTHMPTYIETPVRDPESPTGQRMHQMRMRSAIIVEPDAVERRRFNTGRACIACGHYNWKAGQGALSDPKNAKFKLAIYQSQARQWAGVGVHEFALCDNKPDMLVGPAGSCEFFRPGKNGYLHFVSSGIKKVGTTIGKAADFVFAADKRREEDGTS